MSAYHKSGRVGSSFDSCCRNYLIKEVFRWGLGFAFINQDDDNNNHDDNENIGDDESIILIAKPSLCQYPARDGIQIPL